MKKKTAIVTDSNSGITQAQAKELGVFVLPMPFFINEELFFEDISLINKEISRIELQTSSLQDWRSTTEL